MNTCRLLDHALRYNGMLKVAASALFVLMLVVAQTGYAESWYDLSEDPQGKTRQMPMQIEVGLEGGGIELLTIDNALAHQEVNLVLHQRDQR